MFTDIDNEQKMAIILKTVLSKIDNGNKIKEFINKFITIDEYDNKNFRQYIDKEITSILEKTHIVPFKNKNNTTLDIIGSGSFANVYKSKHNIDNNVYAIKRVTLDEELYENIDDVLHEIKILAKLKYHPNIIKYHHSWIDDIIIDDDSDNEEEQQLTIYKKPLFLNIQLELCDYTLREYMCSYIYDIKPIERVKLWSGLISAIKHLHNNNIIHRDIKPSNIFIKDGVLKLGDFGLSRMYDEEKSCEISKSIDIGCSYYRAPEIDTGYYTFTVDVYSAGIILLELLLNYSTMMEKDKIVRNMLKSGKMPKLLLNEYNTLITKMIVSVNHRITIYDVDELLLMIPMPT